MRHADRGAHGYRAAATLALLLALSSTGADAQTIAGRVVDANGSANVFGAGVRLVSSSGDSLAHTLTDSTGAFRFASLRAGKYALVVRHGDFTPLISELVDVALSQTVVVELRIGRDVVVLDPLVVTARTTTHDRLAGYRERVALNAFGKFVTRDAIDRNPNAEVSDLLANLPSVRVVPVKRNASPTGMTTYVVMMRGSGNESAPEGADPSSAGLCAPAIFVDGSRVAQSARASIDDLVRSQVLEGIEVYSSFTSVPVEYQTMGDCGAVLLWTRQETGRPRGHWLRNAIGVAALGVLVGLAF